MNTIEIVCRELARQSGPGNHLTLTCRRGVALQNGDAKPVEPTQCPHHQEVCARTIKTPQNCLIIVRPD